MALKARFRTQLPASVVGGPGIAITKRGLVYTFALDPTQFTLINNFDPTVEQILIYDPTTGLFSVVLLSTLISSSQTQQIKTTAGDINVAATDGAIVVNKVVGAATAVNFPLAVNKIGDCLVADLKRDAGTNNITINPTAPETIMGLASYVISNNGGSLRLKPIAGVGYII